MQAKGCEVMRTLKLIILTGLMLFLMLFFGSCQGQTQSIIVPVTVKSGDTLYGIVIDLADQHGDERDIREIVYYAAVDNGKYNKDIFPGEVLNIKLEVPKNEK